MIVIKQKWVLSLMHKLPPLRPFFYTGTRFKPPFELDLTVGKIVNRVMPSPFISNHH